MSETAKPLIPKQTTSSSENIRSVLQDLNSGTIFIPDYQRDSDQWDDNKKSLFIESVLNNLTVPAFFLAPSLEDATKFEVVDGQQRLTSLDQFYSSSLRLVGSDDAPYLGATSVHYAGKICEELAGAYRQAFDSYKLTLIRLPDDVDEGLRMEIFRRINEGGTPLSPQDIRLAYFGACKAVTFVRLVGIYDSGRDGCKRMIHSAKTKYQLDWPWQSKPSEVQQEWNDWWEGRQKAIGQTASEMFLWYIIGRYATAIDGILTNKEYLASQLKMTFTGRTEEVADITCAQLRYESAGSQPKRLCTIDELTGNLFDEFVDWFYQFRLKMPSIGIDRYRRLAFLIAAMSTVSKKAPKLLSDSQWGRIEKFVMRPREMTDELKIEYPEAKGKWPGTTGQKAQISSVFKVGEMIASKET